MKCCEGVRTPVSNIGINCVVLYLKVTRTYLWRIGWHILVPLRVCVNSTKLEFCPENRDAVGAALGSNPLKLYITSILVSRRIKTFPIICGDNKVNIVNLCDDFLQFHNLEYKNSMIFFHYAISDLLSQFGPQCRCFIHDNELFTGL